MNVRNYLRYLCPVRRAQWQFSYESSLLKASKLFACMIYKYSMNSLCECSELFTILVPGTSGSPGTKSKVVILIAVSDAQVDIANITASSWFRALASLAALFTSGRLALSWPMTRTTCHHDFGWCLCEVKR